MKIIYQLFASGISGLSGGKFKMHSKKVFSSKSDAENYIPEFSKTCHDSSFLHYATEEDFKVSIIELEFYD